jgi:hypothetical protein
MLSRNYTTSGTTDTAATSRILALSIRNIDFPQDESGFYSEFYINIRSKSNKIRDNACA